MDFGTSGRIDFYRGLQGSPGPEPATPTTARDCNSCPAQNMCIGTGIATADLHSLPLIGQRRLRRGQALFRAGDDFGFCYSVRSGTLKSSLPLSDGREQVTGFHSTGELLGADGLATGRHPTTAVALEDCSVCTFPAALINEAATLKRDVRSQLWSLIAMELVRERDVVALLATGRAEQRVAAFLVTIAKRLGARGYSEREFHLRMSRGDIGSYLGITLETVSRTLSAFAAAGWIEVQKKHIRILDRERLEEEAPPAPLQWAERRRAFAAA
jgi:CRP/FNR family transcriptional regulator